MLPPPRKPVADTPANPAPPLGVSADAASEPVSNPGGVESFAPDEMAAGSSPSSDVPGETDFFSELSDLATSSAAAHSTSGPASAASSGLSQKKRGSSGSNQKWIWITSGGVAVVAAGLIVAVMLLGGTGAAPSVAGGNLGLPAHLLFDWPENERLAAQLSIDGKSETIPTSGAIDFKLSAGSHRIDLRRLGNAPIDQTVELKQDDRYEFKPEWKTVEATSVSASSAGAGGSDMLVSDALPELRHWSTDVDAARREASREKKDVFLVFFGADNRQWCLSLAADLLVKSEFRHFVDPKFELVLLEEPPAAASSTADGGVSGPAIAIAALAKNYGVTSFPTIVLTDADGIAYYREEYKQVSLVDHLKSFADGLALRRERERLFAATQTGSDSDRLTAAQLALDWLEKNDLAAFNRGAIQSWLELAEKVDPNNEHGQFESFFFADLRQRLQSAGKDDPGRIRAASQPLDDWVKAGRKFKNVDLAAATYLTVARLLFNAGDPQAAFTYVDGAYNCSPTDPRLKAYLAELHDMMTAPESFGSGFVFAPGGYILTNNHVIAGEGKLFVRIPGSKNEIPADVVTASPAVDLAVIKMSGEFPELKPLSLANLTLERGSDVLALGYPLPEDFGNINSISKDDLKLTHGLVSAPPTPTERFYVLDIRVNPGNSGGPLLDMRGEVVGIVTAKTVSRDEKEDTYGLAIPGKSVAAFIAGLKDPIAGFHSLDPAESAKLPEFDKATKVDSLASPSVVQIVKRR